MRSSSRGPILVARPAQLRPPDVPGDVHMHGSRRAGISSTPHAPITFVRPNCNHQFTLTGLLHKPVGRSRDARGCVRRGVTVERWPTNHDRPARLRSPAGRSKRNGRPSTPNRPPRSRHESPGRPSEGGASFVERSIGPKARDLVLGARSEGSCREPRTGSEPS